MKLTRPVATVADLREFLAAAEALGLPDTAQVVGRTRVSLAPDGAPLRELTVRTDTKPGSTR